MATVTPNGPQDHLTAAVLAALEAAGVSAMLCLEGGQLLGMTSGAASLVASGHWLSVRHGRLSCADGSVGDLIKRGCAAVSTVSGPAQIGFVVQPTAGGDRPLTLRFSLFTGVVAGSAQPLVLILAGAGDTPDPAAWRAAFGFTATEAAVALMIFEGLSVKQIAALRGVTVETIRSHVKTIFQKARVSRMGQLSAVLRQYG